MDIERVLPFVFIGVFIGTFVLIVIATKNQRKKARENLARLAERLGLQVHAPAKRGIFGTSPTSLSGTFRGRAIRVFSYSTGSGKNRTLWCAVAAPVNNPSGLKLRISKENAFTVVGRKFGIDDVATGDEAFDREFYVKSNQPDFIRAALIPEIRQRLADVWKTKSRGLFSVDETEVRYAETGNFSKAAVCERIPLVAEAVCDLGEVVETFSA